MTIPELGDLTRTYFVRLSLTSAYGKTKSDNFYWLSTSPDRIDWNKTTWMYTPVIAFADFTGLQKLPQTAVLVNVSREHHANGDDTLHARIKNPSKQLAFFLRLKVVKEEDGGEVLPVLWEDNYISLVPGEIRTVTATFAHKDVSDSSLKLEIFGPNILTTSTLVQ